MDTQPTQLPKMSLKLKKGALHKALGVASDKKLTVDQMKKAKQSPDALTRKRATFALNARNWKHK